MPNVMRTHALLLNIALTGCVVHMGDDPTSPPVVQDPPVDPPAVPPADDLLRIWSGCMALPDFHSTHMTATWSTLRTTTNETCVTCHSPSVGKDGFAISSDENVFFQNLTQHRVVIATFFVPDKQAQRVTANRDIFGRFGTGTFQHPRFDTNGPAMQALLDFTSLTDAHFTLNECGPPRLMD